MPASELGWATPPKVPFFVDVYRSKRKVSSVSSTEQQLNLFASPQDGDVPAAKRKCEWDWGSRNDPQLQSDMEINHNNVTFNEDVARQPDRRQLQTWCCTGPSFVSPVVRVPSPWPSPWPSGNVASSPVVADSTVQEALSDDRAMEMNGETCLAQAALAAELEAACLSMDTDCTPDPSQYDTRRVSDSPPDCTRTYGYCGAGKPSPVSGRIRCYCKPSWEGMLDMRPYISDIY